MASREVARDIPRDRFGSPGKSLRLPPVPTGSLSCSREKYRWIKCNPVRSHGILEFTGKALGFPCQVSVPGIPQETKCSFRPQVSAGSFWCSRGNDAGIQWGPARSNGKPIYPPWVPGKPSGCEGFSWRPIGISQGLVSVDSAGSFPLGVEW